MSIIVLADCVVLNGRKVLMSLCRKQSVHGQNGKWVIDLAQSVALGEVSVRKTHPSRL